MNTINKLANRRKDEKGFTLIELVIVVAILGILAAVGIPAFGHIMSWSKVNAVHANNDVALKSYTVAITEAGVGNNVYQGNGGATMTKYAEIANELAPELSTDEFTVGFTYMPDENGDIQVCAYTIGDNGQLGRTDGPAACNTQGPNMGLLNIA